MEIDPQTHRLGFALQRDGLAKLMILGAALRIVAAGFDLARQGVGAFSRLATRDARP